MKQHRRTNLEVNSDIPAGTAFSGVKSVPSRFFMRGACRGYAGRQAEARDIRDYTTKGASNV